MSSEKFTDEYGFTGPLPTTSSQRVVPTGNFRPGLSIGEPAPDFQLPNHRGEIVSFRGSQWCPDGTAFLPISRLVTAVPHAAGRAAQQL